MRLEAEDKIPLPVTLTWNYYSWQENQAEGHKPSNRRQGHCRTGTNSQSLKYLKISVVPKKLELNLRSEIRGKRASLTLSTKLIRTVIFIPCNDPPPGEDLEAATSREPRSSVRRILKGELLHLCSYSIVSCWCLWTSNFQLIRFCSESAAPPALSTVCVRQCEKCHGNALALLKCCWLVPLEKTNKILWRYLRTKFDPLNSRDTTPLLLMVCFAGTPRSKHYVHMAATASGQARMSLQYPHSNWKWECNILERRNGKAEWGEQQCVPWLHTRILSCYSKSSWMPPKISEISNSQGLVHAYR